ITARTPPRATLVKTPSRANTNTRSSTRRPAGATIRRSSSTRNHVTLSREDGEGSQVTPVMGLRSFAVFAAQDDAANCDASPSKAGVVLEVRRASQTVFRLHLVEQVDDAVHRCVQRFDS